jgi:mannose/cellobiose epimerase-like protein (N-acyl-D-glucosamine 2-epimerase family)
MNSRPPLAIPRRWRQRFRTAIAVAVLAGTPAALLPSQPDSPDQRLAALVPAIEKNLRENVIPFWFPRSVDKTNGGFVVHYGPKGEALEGGTKAIVTQVRQLWLASRLLRSDYGVSGLRDAADTGFRFLRDRMWDREDGGFYWSVDPTGTKVLQPHKHLYGQAFGLYALSEYYLASGNADALDLANQLFDLLESRAHDSTYGGYREFFARDWSAAPPGVNPYLGAPADLKLMNTHMHLMEAFTTYVRAGAGLRARERLSELVAIESQAVIRHEWMAGTDRHRADWTPVLETSGPGATRVSYGHDVENIWLIADALRALGQPTAPYHGLFRGLFDAAVRHGWDSEAGGFFESGLPGKPADRRVKTWWVEAEALVGSLAMLELTGDAKYADTFARTWQFVDGKQTDWAAGEWFEAIEPDGQPRRGNKAHPWKGGYHNGRALIESLERIRRITASRSKPVR